MKRSSEPIIADSSGLYSLIVEDDSNSQPARKIIQKIDKTIIVPAEVFSEVLNILGKKMGRDTQLEAAEILMSEDFSIVESDDKIRQQAINKLKSLKKSVSYTDCAVMAFADEYKTKEIFGFDEVFSKEGYRLP